MELLGLLAIHTFLEALEAFYNLPGSPEKVYCANQRVLYKSKCFRQRIKVGSSQADIKRTLHNVKTGLKTMLDFVWVESYQGR